MILRFAGIPTRFSQWENSRVTIIPVPYEGTVSYKKGTKNGPKAIIEASNHLELYDEELDLEPYTIGIHTSAPLSVERLAPEDMTEAVYQRITFVINHNKFPVTVGGEHSITIGIVKAFQKHYPCLSVLQLDAHADLRNYYLGSSYNHACVMRRISEQCKFLGLGIRSLSAEEAQYLKSRSLKLISSQEIKDKKHWRNLVSRVLSDEVYLTIDLDVLDPSIMPAVGTPEPGGLRWEDILEIMRFVIENKKILGIDVVELCPLPNQVAPDFLAAKLIYKLIGYRFFR